MRDGDGPESAGPSRPNARWLLRGAGQGTGPGGAGPDAAGRATRAGGDGGPGSSGGGEGTDAIALPPPRDTALIAVALAAVSTSGPIIAATAAPALAIAFWRNAMASGAVVPAALLRRRAELRRLGRRQWALCVLAGTLLAGHFATWVPSVTLTSVASSTALVASQPVWAALLAHTAGRRVRPAVWAGIVVSVAGAALLTGADLSLSSRALVGDLLATVGGALAAGYVTVGAAVRSPMPPGNRPSRDRLSRAFESSRQRLSRAFESSRQRLSRASGSSRQRLIGDPGSSRQRLIRDPGSSRQRLIGDAESSPKRLIGDAGSSRKRLIPGMSTTAYTAVCYSTCALLLLALCLATGQRLAGYDGGTWEKLVALTVGAQLLGHSLLNVVLRTTSPTVVSLAILFEVPGAGTIAAIWLGQVPPLTALPGLLLLLAGIGLVIRAGARAVPVE